MSNLDKNVSNYTIYELMAIIKVDTLDSYEIINKTSKVIEKFKYINPEISNFFKNIQNRLLGHSNQFTENEIYDLDTNDLDTNDLDTNEIDTNDITETFENRKPQAVQWYSNEYLTQDDPTQRNKITNRQDTTKLFENPHLPMKKEQIATTDTFELPVKQDSLNPNLKNTIKRVINLDSQFRQYTNGAESISTDYTLDLSDTLKNVISLTLYSFQIPQSWYVIDTSYGNTCFWIVDGINAIPISIPSGSYAQVEFKDQLNISFTNTGFTFNSLPVQYNINNGILSLHLYGGVYNKIIDNEQITFTITEQTTIVFYDFTGNLQCNNNCSSKTTRFLNNSLGWIMGYRLPYININIDGNYAPAMLDLNGTKYLMLVVDDYNQNHVNSSIVSISQFSSTLKIPSYYSPDIPHTCIYPQQGNNLKELIIGVTEKSLSDFQSTNPLNGLLIGSKYEEQYTSVDQILPSAPRTLTQSQIYTINEIKKNRSNNTNYLIKAPTTADILAILPVKTSIGVPNGSLLVEFSGSLQENSRVYFGPVDIDRLSIKLIDDKGNVLNLNGMDWCVTFICECLYQY